jgi:membrane protease YdiL (CAAX protease family)
LNALFFDISWHPGYLEPVVAVGTFSLLYLVYHYFPAAAIFRRPGAGSSGNAPFSDILNRSWGAVLLGVLPLLVVLLIFKRPPEDFGAALSGSWIYYALAAGVCLLLLPLLLAHASSRGKSRSHPVSDQSADSRPPNRPRGWALLLNGAGWLIYLSAYEFCLRGFLLFSLARCAGSWPAVAAVTCIYTAIHLPKDAGEAAGSLLIGPVLCVLSLASGSILPALIVHLFIANTMDLSGPAGSRNGAGS